jgi:aryl-alcohol dehydrogenase-like predicted oxidoreductase
MNYRILGRSGLRVSELCLGTMTFGTNWVMGADKETSRAVFDAYANAGGNFIDTANRYHEGQSEEYVGEFIASDRDHFVLATKYTLQMRMGDPNFAGNHRKNMVRSVEASLKRLATEYIDVLWIHAWDDTMQPDEVMRSLEDLVRTGKVLHIGISDTPAWIVSCCNTIAELRGWSSFVGLQIEYSLITRDAERDLIPMADTFGLTVTPWAPLGAGILTGKYLQSRSVQGARLTPASVKMNDRNLAIAAVVDEIANEIGASSPQVALAWIRRSQPRSIPILGARRAEQLQDNLGCLNVTLTQEHMARLDAVSAIVLGFPHDFLRAQNIQDLMFAGVGDRIRR